MRAITDRISRRGGQLVLVGSGSTREAEEFLEETSSPLRLVVDPELKGYRAAMLGRSLLAPYSPVSWWKGLLAFLRGHRPGRVAGDKYQLGGLFVIAPGHRVELAHVAATIYDPMPLSEVLETLERIQRDEDASEAIP